MTSIRSHLHRQSFEIVSIAGRPAYERRDGLVVGYGFADQVIVFN
jgi:hypothetical protein